MKIKEVHFQKLFSLEKYNNERIGFTVEVEEGEDPNKIAGQLFFRITSIEECLNTYRSILDKLGYASIQSEHYLHKVQHTTMQIADMKVEIQELLAKAEKGDVDSKLRHACQRQSYKQLSEELASYQEKHLEWNEKVKLLAKAKVDLQERISLGNFSLDRITVPETPQERVYYE